MRDDEDREYEAQQEANAEAAAEAYQEELLNELSPQWAKDHGLATFREHYEEHYEKIIKDFKDGRLQSYYVEHPHLAVPAHESLIYAQSLMPVFPRAAIIFAATAVELAMKAVLVKPLVFGLVHVEELATFITQLTTDYKRMDWFMDSLTKILAQLGGPDLKAFKRPNTAKTLWEEIKEVKKIRNAIIHDGETTDISKAELAVAVAEELLSVFIPQTLENLGRHFHKPMTICATVHPKILLE